MRTGDDLDIGPKRQFADFAAADRASLVRDVKGLAKRYGLPASVDVEDLVQQGQAALFRAYDGCANERIAHRYAFTAAHNALQSAWRRAARREDISWLDRVRVLYYAQAPEHPDESVQRLETVAYVRRAVQELPEQQRRAVSLVDLAELRPQEAAQVMGVTRATLKSLLQNGRRRLRQVLTLPTILAGWCARARRGAKPATTAALTAISQAALLGLVFTAPLTVLPSRNTTPDAVQRLPQTTTRAVSLPFAVSMLPSVSLLSVRVQPVRRLVEHVHHLGIARLPTTSVTPPDVPCVRKNPCNGEQITLSVLGIERSVAQPFVKICPVAPTVTEPYVTCRDADRAP